jgi:hypothetical protein
VQKDEVSYSVYADEICSSRGLWDEGKEMANCVFSYSRECRAQHSAIFSLRMFEHGKEKRLATVEVSLRNRTIVQARAKCNRNISQQARRMMIAWAKQANLSIAQYV